MESVLWAFSEIYKKGLIYKDFRVSPYCYRCQTALSVSDTRMDDATRMKQDRAITVRFPVRGAENTFFLAWTTTPWTLPSNLALAVGPDIPYVYMSKEGETLILAKSALGRYKKELEGASIVRELTGRELVAEKLRYEPLFPYFRETASNLFQVLPQTSLERKTAQGLFILRLPSAKTTTGRADRQGSVRFVPWMNKGVSQPRLPILRAAMSTTRTQMSYGI